MKKALALLAFVVFAIVPVLAQDGHVGHGGFASPVVPVQNSLFAWLLLLAMLLRSWLRF
jgi:hypothetical protein